MIIWNYSETRKVCESAWSILEFGYTCNYILDNSGKLYGATKK